MSSNNEKKIVNNERSTAQQRRLNSIKRHLTESAALILPSANGTGYGSGIENPLEENTNFVMDYIRETKPEKYSMVEWELRCKLAVAYRIADYYNWKQVIFNHITVRIPGSEKEENGPYFLINPLGLRFNEVTASCLMTVTIDGEIIDQGTTDGTLFRQGYVIHSAIHEVRHDVMCCWHSHQHDATAIAMTKEGLLPLSQEALDIYPLIKYHPFEGTANSLDERPRLQKSLGNEALILVLENHGPCALGPNIETAFHLMYFFCRSATYQQRALAAVGGDISRLHLPSKEKVDQMIARAKTVNFADGSGVVADPKVEFRAIARVIEERDGLDNIYV